MQSEPIEPTTAAPCDSTCDFRPTWALPDSARLINPDVQRDATREALDWYNGPVAVICTNASRDKWWLGVGSDDAREPWPEPPGFRTIERWVLCPLSAEEVAELCATLYAKPGYDAIRRQSQWMRAQILVPQPPGRMARRDGSVARGTPHVGT